MPDDNDPYSVKANRALAAELGIPALPYDEMLRDFVRWSKLLVDDHAGEPWGDDGLDYFYAASNSLLMTLTALRVPDATILREWFEEPISEWLATDGDLRFRLADFLFLTDPKLAEQWAAYVERAQEAQT
jgi:hypothetical protein